MPTPLGKIGREPEMPALEQQKGKFASDTMVCSKILTGMRASQVQNMLLLHSERLAQVASPEQGAAQTGVLAAPHNHQQKF